MPDLIAAQVEGLDVGNLTQGVLLQLFNRIVVQHSVTGDHRAVRLNPILSVSRLTLFIFYLIFKMENVHELNRRMRANNQSRLFWMFLAYDANSFLSVIENRNYSRIISFHHALCIS